MDAESDKIHEDQDFEMEDDAYEDEVIEVNQLDIKGSKGKVVKPVITKTIGKRKRRLTSKVWSHSEFLPVGDDGKQKCKCIKCGIVYPADSKYGTGNMLRHSKKCVRTDTHDIGQLLLAQSNGTMSMRSSKFDHEIFRELVSEAIVKHDLPFQFVEYEGIRALFHYLCEEVKPISRNTAKVDVLKMYKREKNRLKHLFEVLLGRISLTSDLWTSINTDGFLCITAHFIDKEWKLHKRVKNYCFMPPPHNGICLSEKFYSLLIEWGIEKKLFSITLDNASSNDSFVGMLRCQLILKDALLGCGDYFHVRCCAHVLNLIVQDGLKEIDEAVNKVRESIKYVRGSQGRKQIFFECVNQVSLDPKKGLRQDVLTRWNTTFLMIESAIFYCWAFCHLGLSDSNYKNCPSQEEWVIIEKIHRFLGVFYDVTCISSGNKYPTANLYFPQVFMVELTLKKEMESSNIFMKRMATQMYEKFSKYWSEYSLILAIAVILDPRYKLPFLEFSYKKLYGSGSLESLHVRGKLFDLFDGYMRNSPTASMVTSSSGTSSGNFSSQKQERFFGKGNTDILKEFSTFESQEFASVQKTQLELYLDEPRCDVNVNLDVLDFWKADQFRYPELSCMARDILSIPISTVASESAFSVGSRVLDQYRSTLKPDTVEALICTRDWLFGVPGDLEMKASLDELTEDIINFNISKDEPSISSML